ncbi:hypothetical protein SALBM311S_07133 [Streptomyces alboniger]
MFRSAVLGAVRGLPAGEQAFHHVGQQEPGHEQEQGGGDAEDLGAGRVQRLRHQVQADHAEHQAAGQAQHEMAAVGHPQCRPAARQRHQERAQRDEDRHVPLVSDQGPLTHLRPQQH